MCRSELPPARLLQEDLKPLAEKPLELHVNGDTVGDASRKRSASGWQA